MLASRFQTVKMLFLLMPQTCEEDPHLFHHPGFRAMGEQTDNRFQFSIMKLNGKQLLCDANPTTQIRVQGNVSL